MLYTHVSHTHHLVLPGLMKIAIFVEDGFQDLVELFPLRRELTMDQTSQDFLLLLISDSVGNRVGWKQVERLRLSHSKHQVCLGRVALHKVVREVWYDRPVHIGTNRGGVRGRLDGNVKELADILPSKAVREVDIKGAACVSCHLPRHVPRVGHNGRGGKA